jgi:hypothetical protein
LEVASESPQEGNQGRPHHVGTLSAEPSLLNCDMRAEFSGWGQVSLPSKLNSGCHGDTLQAPIAYSTVELGYYR